MTSCSASTEQWGHQGLCMGRDPKVPTSFLCGFGFDSYNVSRRGPLNMLISVPPSWSLSTLVCGGLYVHLCEPTCVCVGVCASVHTCGSQKFMSGIFLITFHPSIDRGSQPKPDLCDLAPLTSCSGISYFGLWSVRIMGKATMHGYWESRLWSPLELFPRPLYLWFFCVAVFLSLNLPPPHLQTHHTHQPLPEAIRVGNNCRRGDSWVVQLQAGFPLLPMQLHAGSALLPTL